MHHDVGTVQSRPLRIVIEERPAGREDVPRIIEMEIHHPQPQREVHAGHHVAVAVERDELALWKDLAMIVKLLDRVRRVVRIDEPADLDDGLVMVWLDECDAIVGGKHELSDLAVLCGDRRSSSQPDSQLYI